MALVLLMTVSIFFYALYIRQQIYYEGTRAMLETYEQVNKTFTMFAQRNWNVLTDWGGYLREMAAPETATQWKDFEEEKKTWNYSDFYMANENGDYWTVDGREGLGSENIQAVFTALQVAGEPIVSSYTATSGIRKVVFAVPVEPITMSGVTYTSLAVSYDNDTIEEMIGGRAYGGRSDCYIIHPNGDIMLSEEPKSEITAWMENLFDYLETNTEVNETYLLHMSWASPIIAIALMFGVLAGVLTWVAGPSKGIFAVGKAGYLPPFFQKANKNGVQRNILLIQGGVVTLLALLFVVMPSVQSFYQILSQLTVLLYLIMYMLMFSAAIVLRYKMKDLARPFRLGKGNGLMWLLGCMGFCGALLAFILSFIPPSQISTGSNTVWFSVLVIGCIVVVGAPFLIYAARKPSWRNPQAQFEPFHWEQAAQTPANIAAANAAGTNAAAKPADDRK